MGHTTFVVGAGASCEFCLLDGARLRDRITANLPNYHFAGVSVGSRSIEDARHTLSTSLRTALSIDDCMHTHKDNKDVQAAGKWAIVHEILGQERDSCLTLDERRLEFETKHRYEPSTDTNRVFDAWNTWLVALLRLLTAECPRDKIAERLSRVSFVVFNYDRCIEHGLECLLTWKLGGDRDAATELAKQVTIVHPYGCLDQPWGQGVPFGYEPDRAPYARMMQNIRTFTESPVDAVRQSVLDEIHRATRVVFLGFSFLSLNMRLLTDPRVGDRKLQECWGTAYRSSEVDRDHAVRAISNVVKIKSTMRGSGPFWPRLYDMTCADFVMHNQRAFGFGD